MRWRQTAVAIGLTSALAASLVGPRPAGATVHIRELAQAAGYPAQECSYCHSFSLAHMREQARKVGIQTMNCTACHGNRLPKQGLALFNERGRWLLAEKKRRNAVVVDPKWLQGYVAPSPSPSTGGKH